ncbi:MAG TPA: surface-adhesin E family protein [Novimethylophilus sp.]|jgi:hypothetical protein|uniref:surface-adhesin E family protein n=1 Tax=Novimethylophilus sp. TaxID=2137426 RepID=UPI002F41767E
MFTRHFTSIGIAVAQLFLSPACHAADWYEVGGFPDKGVKVYVDESSLVVDHDTVVTGWIRFEYKTPRERDGKQLIGQSSLRMANCGDRRYWISEAWGHPPNNTEPVRLYSDTQEWQLAAPDSEARIALDALCFEAQSLFSILWDKAGTGLSRIRHGGMGAGQ